MARRPECRSSEKPSPPRVAGTRGIDVGADNVVVTSGAKPIMFYTMLALVDEGDEVLYPNPGFPIYESMINFVGGVPAPIKLLSERDFEIDVDEVAASITPKTTLMVLNSPNNPCGSVVERETIRQLAELAVEHDLWVLSDEIYIRLLFEGEHCSIASFPGLAERTIILDGFSKTYANDGLAHRVRRHAGGARSPLLEAEHQQRLVHGVRHPDGGGRGAPGSAGSSPMSSATSSRPVATCSWGD